MHSVVWLINHGWEGLQVRSVVPRVGARVCGVGEVASEAITDEGRRDDRVVAESSAGEIARIRLREVVYPSVNRYDGDATSFDLVATANHGSNRPGKY